MKKFPELETRRIIYDLIEKNPGLHLSKIAEMLNIRISLVEYHLAHLERNDVIIAIKDTGYKRFYVKSVEIGVRDKKILALLRQETPLKIVLFLLKNPKSVHKDILSILDIAPSTLSYYLKKLIEKEIIIEGMLGEEKGYNVKDEKSIIGLLVRYKPYQLLESFKHVWLDFKVE